jgi:hypothetical protein
MQWPLIQIVAAAAALVHAAPDAQITPGPELRMRQDSKEDPAVLGWVSTSGASRCNAPVMPLIAPVSSIQAKMYHTLNRPHNPRRLRRQCIHDN